jgi:RHS repeat-associated protein
LYKREVRNETETALYSAIDVQFDPIGRPFKQSNPHTGSPVYWTETRFDALGRVAVVIAPANAQTTYSYSGNTVMVTDPSGKARKSETDALGRLVKIYEPDVTAQGNPLTVTTEYSHNALDLLTQVLHGSQTRTFNYDDMGRLTSQVTPEAGSWSYTYNAFSQVLTRTDARGVVTTYQYDTLNRPTTVSYNVGSTGVAATSSVTYAYGTDATQNNKGRLITVTDGPGSTGLTYDVLGRVTQEQKVISGTTYTVGYAYNLASEVASVTYPSGRVVNQEFDSIGRLTAVKNGTAAMADAFSYDSAGHVTGFRYNGASDFTAAFGFSADRLQLTSLTYMKASQKLLDLAYGYGSATSNNGQVLSITDSTGTQEMGRSVTYTYDALHRLKTAVTAGSTSYPQWGLSWTYDRYGNRTLQTVTHGSGPSSGLTISPTTNRITDSGYSYDANGNMTNDGVNALTYDAENRQITAGNATYTYDGASLRVKKVSGGTTTVYVFSGQKVIAEYENGAAVGSPTREYVYLGSQRLAKIEGGATTYYHHDHLSARVMTNTSGSVIAQSGHFPFGENWYETGGTNKLRFTSYERDAESGNDFAIFRYHISRLGRFNSPDRIAGNGFNPQRLNRYAYSLNDPINLADPTGLDPDTKPAYFYCIVCTYLPDDASSPFSGWGGGFGDSSLNPPPVGLDQASGGGGGPTISAPAPPTISAPPPLPPCTNVELGKQSVEVSVLIGLEAELGGLAKLGGALFKNLTTGETGASVGAQAIVGVEVSTTNPPDVPITTPAGPVVHSALVGPFKKEIGKSFWETEVTFGLAIGVGFEVTFKPGDFLNAKCR